MQIIDGFMTIPKLSLALGTFDGIHLGHKEVIESAVNFAKKYETKSAVITFKEHPFAYLHNTKPLYLCTREQKIEQIEKLGVDYLIEIDFKEIANLTPEQYLKDVILKYFSPKAISTGFNHRFGKGQAGDVQFLAFFEDKYYYVYSATPPKQIYGEVISTTKIKNYLKNRNIAVANTMLGREFSIKGKVIHGKNLGKALGFPTANISYHENIIPIDFGVYSTKIKTKDGNIYKALTNFGVAPTVSNINEAFLESYILDFSGDLYNQDIEIFFVKNIRPEIKFNCIADLTAQIEKDIKHI